MDVVVLVLVVGIFVASWPQSLTVRRPIASAPCFRLLARVGLTDAGRLFTAWLKFTAAFAALVHRPALIEAAS
ncbi:MAG: hypothetical protein M3Z06_14345 [Actinomycetota bacterium]|nr:hypothetical protein [Actinomycetota bacterium]